MDHHHKHVHEHKQENPSFLVISANKLASYDHKQVKRNEWSEGAVSCLLEAYETKWVLRNKAKLKGQDWHDVAKCVSSRGVEVETRSLKTLTQCKNKIESMKKRYRSESAIATCYSSWPLFPKLDLLMRGNTTPQMPMLLQCHNLALPMLSLRSQPSLSLATVARSHVQATNSHGSNGVDLDINGDRAIRMKLHSNKHTPISTDSSTLGFYNVKENTECEGNTNLNNKGMQKKRKKSRKRERGIEVEESLKWVRDVVVKCEEVRMKSMRELEKMRAEADEKGGELELKKTRIVADTQLEIAKMFANASSNVSQESIMASTRKVSLCGTMLWTMFIDTI